MENKDTVLGQQAAIVCFGILAICARFITELLVSTFSLINALSSVALERMLLPLAAQFQRAITQCNASSKGRMGSSLPVAGGPVRIREHVQ